MLVTTLTSVFMIFSPLAAVPVPVTVAAFVVVSTVLTVPPDTVVAIEVTTAVDVIIVLAVPDTVVTVVLAPPAIVVVAIIVVAVPDPPNIGVRRVPTMLSVLRADMELSDAETQIRLLHE